MVHLLLGVFLLVHFLARPRKLRRERERATLNPQNPQKGASGL